MTIAQFREYNKLGTMPCEWIGQGYGYITDNAWNELNDDDIIYIPEYGYDKKDDGTVFVSRNDAYSKSDFIQLIMELDDRYRDIGRCVQVKRMAAELFEAVDWQYPESLLNEEFFED
jgi:hypothetical protein